MTVFILQRVSPGVRGQLTRWMLEVHTGVFVGRLSARVREKLWALLKGRRGTGACVMVHGAKTEQGFLLDVDGDTKRELVDMEGLVLMRRRDA